jgi:hypothetical protein
MSEQTPKSAGTEIVRPQNDHKQNGKPPKDGWDKAGVISGFLSGVLIPAAVAIVGVWLSSTLKNRELNVEYVKVAVGVLQVRDTALEVRGLRTWAAAVLDKLGPVPIPATLRDSLIRGHVALPTGGGVGGFGTGGGWVGRFPSLNIQSTPRSGLEVRFNGNAVGPTPRRLVVWPGAPTLIEWLDRGRLVCVWHGAVESFFSSKSIVCDVRNGSVAAAEEQRSPS